jgi:cytoskeletal protein CcmA (bactofilin family)
LPLAVLTLPRLALRSPRVAAVREVTILPAVVRPLVARVWTGALWKTPGSPVWQGPDNGDRLVMGGTYVLGEDETLDGNLIVLGGIATLESGSVVERDVVVLGGTVRVDGTVEGDVTVIGGMVDLGETAAVEGDVNALAANLERAEGARIEGSLNTETTGAFPVIITEGMRTPTVDVSFNPVVKMLLVPFWSFVWAVGTLLVMLFVPNHAGRVAKTVVGQPWISLGMGMLTTLVGPILLAAIAITLIGIPVTLVGAFLLVVTWGFGVMSVGLEVGKRIAQAFHQEWAPAVMACAGTFVLTLMTGALNLVPCIGWVAPAFVGALGLGAVILTRFGTQDYLPYVAPASAPLAPVEGISDAEAAPVIKDMPAVESEEPPADEQ